MPSTAWAGLTPPTTWINPLAKLIDPSTLETRTPQAVVGNIARVQPIVATGEGQGLSSAGADLERVFAEMDENLTRARRASQLADAMGKATGELGEAEIAFQRDPDFKTVGERFVKKSEEIRKRLEETIDDPVVRSTFARQYGTLAQTKRLNVMQIAAKAEADYNVASLDTSLSVYAQTAANAANVAERDIAINEANIAIESMRLGGWITDVDAGKRQRDFLAKVDTAMVLRDMQTDPAATAVKLGISAEYAPNLDPVQRERLIDSGLRQAQTRQTEMDREADKLRKQREEATLKEAFQLDADGNLTREWVEANKANVGASEYKSLLKMLDPQDRKDDPNAYATLERMVYDDPAGAVRFAFRYHQQGLIRNETLATIQSRARTISRDEGPKSAYERHRAYITNALKPSDMVQDPAASARFALAMREYDDFAKAADRSDAELRSEADRILRDYSLVDMVQIARKTSIGGRQATTSTDPQKVLDDLRARAERLKADYDAGRIPVQQYNREMSELNKLRKAAEAAQNNGTKR